MRQIGHIERGRSSGSSNGAGTSSVGFEVSQKIEQAVKPTFPRRHTNSGKSYHHSTAKGTVSPLPPLDGMVLVIGPRLKSHLPISTAIQTHPSCRFHLAVDYADTWFAPRVVLNAPSMIHDNREVAHSFLSGLTFNTEEGGPDRELAQIHEICRNVSLVDAVERLLVPYGFTAPSDTQEIIGVLLQLSHA